MAFVTPKYTPRHSRPVPMTQELEDFVRRMDPQTASQILVAVRGTLVALRDDVSTLNHTPETTEVLRRIDAYLGHVDTERARLAA